MASGVNYEPGHQESGSRTNLASILGDELGWAASLSGPWFLYLQSGATIPSLLPSLPNLIWLGPYFGNSSVVWGGRVDASESFWAWGGGRR